MASLSNKKWLLERKNPRIGGRETVVYTGSLRNKPKGWRVVRRIA